MPTGDAALVVVHGWIRLRRTATGKWIHRPLIVCGDQTSGNEIIGRAKYAKGFGNLGNAFLTNVLRLEVSGPCMPRLNIVDILGLIHSTNKL